MTTPVRLRIAAVITVTWLTSACASTGAVPHPFPVPGGTPAAGSPSPPAAPADPPKAAPVPTSRGRPDAAGLDGYAVSSTALSLRGAPYRPGGATPAGFDCSGLVQYVFGQHGLNVPRETREQFRLGRGVGRDELAPGDLVFFTTIAPGASHVGIAIGGDQFVHAPTERGVVRVEHLSSAYWSRRFVGARRPQ